MTQLNSNLQQRINNWLTPTFDKDTQDTIKKLLTTDVKTLEDAF